MAKVIDVRNSGGVFAILGDRVVLPISADYSNTAIPGSVRYSSSTNSLEVYAPNSSNNNVWSPLVTAAQITADVGNYYLATTGGTINGNLDVTGTLTAGYINAESATALYAADIAERYHADSNYLPGTVLIVGGNNEVTLSNKEEDISVAGIVSTEPAYKMNIMAGSDETHPYIALKGKVPCNVIGPVKKGSHLCTSNVPGYAKMANDKTDTRACFAIALENCAEGLFKIQVKV
jgi:hypothetical protein